MMKMNMKLSAMALLSALVLGGTTTATAVFAAEGDTPTETTGTGDGTDTTTTPAATKNGATDGTPAKETGNAYVTFTKSTKPTGPIDPKDPDKPDDNNPGTGEVGDLTLDAIPNNLNFGTQEATAAAQTIELLAKEDATTDRPNSQGDDKATTDTNHEIYTQVTDMAAAKPTWKLSATLNGFNGSLKDASITLANARSQVLTGGNGTALAWDTTNADLPVVGKSITLTSGTPADIVASSKMAGTTQQVWSTKEVHLNVPAGASAEGDYNATIDWTLAIVPGA
ncbi:MAG: WxL domain-containing protein [Lactobacillus sp.]|jgi:hypothetical protein|nr:WxL domain-containing protein [Lactobacillus sp.]MCI2034294.1 WxL domain-containing protein [Lactobacillus sp.]